MKDSLHLLLVDDDQLDRMATRRVLKSVPINVEVTEAFDCASAMAELHSHTFDCALLDFQLPDGDALSLLRSIRASNIDIPIVILTGFGDERTAVELMKAGAADYLAKDRLSRETLAQTLRNVIRIHAVETKARQVVEALQESENRFRTMAACSPMLLWEADAAGQRIFFNRAWLDFTGRPAEVQQGSGWVEYIHPDDVEAYLRDYAQALEQRTAFHAEYRLRRADGEYGWVLESANPLKGAEVRTQGMLGSGIDITERKQNEQAILRNQEHIAALNTQLRESMRETHHRVKNSLQIIAAMVDMRLMDTAHPVAETDLRELGMHINSLAVVHELLTEQAGLDGQGDFLMADRLLEQMHPVLQKLAGDRAVEFEVPAIRLSARQANALPLVTNELVSNAIKYGAGEITLSLQISGNIATLAVRDHGNGFPADFQPMAAGHTGLELVDHLTRWDLSGNLTYGNAPDGGALVTLILPLDTFH